MEEFDPSVRRIGGGVAARAAKANSYPSRALCASASTSNVDIAVMSWAVANGLPRVKLLGTPFEGQSVEP